MFVGRLAAEMQANIRLGLEAGECVTPHPRRTASGVQPARGGGVREPGHAAGGGLFDRAARAPRGGTSRRLSRRCSKRSGSGIQVKEGEQSMMLLNARARNRDDVDYLASGSAMRARYVDSDTGYVTINNVYVQ